mmetsp:Transcript_17838/g.23499  ORF Transcript_17838/g.23499 Transcript_17838/m.23499 type:complete len:215 (-) Transcript_17838:210-854(-)
MILSSSQCQHPFVESAAMFGNKLGHWATSHKGNGRDVRVVTQSCCSLCCTIDHLKHTIRNASFFHKLSHSTHGHRNFFTWLQNNTISSHQSNRNCPHWNHNRKVKRNNTANHSHRIISITALNSFAYFQALSLHELWHRASPLHCLVPFCHTGQSFLLVLPTLLHHYIRQLICMLSNELVEPEHDSGSGLCSHGAPGREGLQCFFNCSIHINSR